jgi:cation diffusion facilitator family transporter
MITALLQAFVVILSGSIALADTIHNFGDAATAFLGIAFMLARLKPKTFTYSCGRVEDLASIYRADYFIQRIGRGYDLFPACILKVGHLYAVAIRRLIGFLGNESWRFSESKWVKRSGAPLLADGYHARVDGWTRLAVLFGALGVWLATPGRPVIGLVITAAILVIVWQAGKQIFIRMLDGVDPGIIDEIEKTASRVEGVAEVSEVKARWIGHTLHARFSIGVKSALSVRDGEVIAREVSHKLRSNITHLYDAAINVVTFRQE